MDIEFLGPEAAMPEMVLVSLTQRNEARPIVDWEP